MLIQTLKISLLLILLTFAPPLESQSGNNVALPVWFWNSPDIEKGNVTVGYSLPHRDSNHAFDEAFQDGALRLFTDRESRIYGERGTASSPGGTMHMGSTLNTRC